MKMPKPLELLQEYTINKKDVIENEDQIIFGEFSYPKNIKTDYEITQKETAEKQYYTIESLLFFMRNMHVIHPEYVNRAKEASIPAVRRPDRKNIINYLTGLTKTMESKDTSTKKIKSQVSGTQHKGKGRKSRNKGHNKYTPY